MKVSDIIAVIEKTAPPGAAASWDNSGLQVAAEHEEIRRIGVVLDPTPAALRQASERGADFILAHHPLSMQPRLPNRKDAYFSSLSLLFREDVWLYSAHTSLDANAEGPVRWLAQELRLQKIRTLDPEQAGQGFAVAEKNAGKTPLERGYGFYGELPAALSYADFRETLARILDKKEWQICGPEPECVRHVACCPGSGGGLLPKASACGADVFITGDIKYHTALDAEEAGLRILDVGHFILEEEMMRRFAALLAAELAVPVVFFPARDPLAADRAVCSY